MFRSRSWFGGGLWKPKNLHSLEHLKYLYNVLSKNQTVSESNKGLLVETLRSISEILIWGDQNDSSVFDFFLEKNMLSFFLKIMKQKCGSYVCVQLLQTLNILFENIRNETSLYYLLSNNHVNSIIVHKFDFSDEEVMAYYISFLKTLSLKLNNHTIHFFYNEHTNDFPLYTEAIKFFNHSESMVRIAVRTLTLNVYRVDDKSMLDFIRNRTAAPYFSNLVWFIGKHVLELDGCLRNESDRNNQNRLADLVAEHLDHLHYINDILCLKISDLNQVLSEHLLDKLFTPLYIRSLINLQSGRSQISRVSGLFLLSQVFLIINDLKLVQILAKLLLESKSDDDTFLNTPPPGPTPPFLEQEDEEEENEAISPPVALINSNITDEEKSKILGLNKDEVEIEVESSLSEVPDRPCVVSLMNALDCTTSDYSTLLALCLIYAITNNSGLCEFNNLELFMKETYFRSLLVEKLVQIICKSCQSDIRLVTLQLAVKLLKQFCPGENVEASEEKRVKLSDPHVASIAGSKEESTSLLRELYKSEEMFLDIFADEYNELISKPLNVEFLMMDAAMLLPPAATPMTGIEFSRRLPCGEVERARKSIRVFFLIRELCILLGIEQDTPLPFNNLKSCVQIGDVLDLNNSDLIACTVVQKDGLKIRRFLVMDVTQLILVEPDTNRLGWGVAKLVGFLQDLEINGDKDESRCLHITIHRPPSGNGGQPRTPLLAAKFIFDDHIRCMAAKQRLTKGRLKARQKKMHAIAKLLDLPSNMVAPASPSYVSQRYSGRDIRPLFGGQRLSSNSRESSSDSVPVWMLCFPPNPLNPLNPLKENKLPPVSRRKKDRNRTGGVPASTGARSRDQQTIRDGNVRRHRKSDGSPRGGPRMPRPRSEEIPLGDMKNHKNRRENILLSTVTRNDDVQTLKPETSTSATGVIVINSESSNFIQPVVIHEETKFLEGATRESQNDAPLIISESKDSNKKRKGKIETV